MRALVLLAAALLLLAGCAANAPATKTVTKTVTTTAEPTEREQTPSITFNKQSNPSREGGQLTVVAVQGQDPWDVEWSDIEARDSSGVNRCTMPTGLVRAGDQMACTGDGPHFISYEPTNTLLYTAEF